MRRFSDSWNTTLAALGFKRSLKKQKGHRYRRHARLETLEERRLLTVFYGTSADDNIIVTNTTLQIGNESFDISLLSELNIDGLGGNDLINASAVTNKVLNIHGGEGDDHIAGGTLNDSIHGDNGTDTIYGNAGNDLIDGGNDPDWIDGGIGNDYIVGGDEDPFGSTEHGPDSGTGDIIYGGAGADELYGNDGNDDIFGGDGDDLIVGGTDYGHLEGGAGNDIIEGGAYADIINGGAGDDNLFGGGSYGVEYDILHGNEDNDTLFATAGNIVLYGDVGDDKYSFSDAAHGIYLVSDTGGTDQFDFSNWTHSSGVEVVYGFAPTQTFNQTVSRPNNPKNVVVRQAAGTLIESVIGSGYSDTLLAAGALIIVTTLADENESIAHSSHGFLDLSLREALALSAITPGVDNIRFANNLFQNGQGTITLTYDDPSEAGSDPDQLIIGSNVAIEGPGVELLTINRTGAGRIFQVDSNVIAIISGLSIEGGNGVADGGGVYLSSASELHLFDIHVTNNSSTSTGGGIYSAGTLYVDYSLIAENTTASWGGGIHSGLGSTLRITSSTIDENDATAGYGGGIAMGASPGIDRMIIFGSTISRNYASGDSGGLVFNSTGAGGAATGTIVNSTFSENESTWVGGLRARYQHAHLDIINSTITQNDGQGGGGLHLWEGATAKLDNTIIAENTSANGGLANIFGTVVSTSSHNLLQAGSAGNLSNTNGNIILAAGASAGLMPVFDDGYLRRGYALLPESPAVDAGNDDAAVAHDLVFDQWGSGFDRIIGEHIDIGATEGHVIQRGTILEVHGTGLDDEILVLKDSIRFLTKDGSFSLFSRLGEYTFDVASASRLDLFGYAGNDKIEIDTSYFSVPSLIIGGDGNDHLLGGAGPDIMTGGAGSDVMTGLDGDDILFGGDGDDILFGGSGNDVLGGSFGDDHLFGGHGTDTLHGGEGNNTENSGDSEVIFKPERLLPDGGGSTNAAPGFAEAPPLVIEGYPQGLEIDIPYLESWFTSPLAPPYSVPQLSSVFIVGWNILPGEFIENGSLVCDKIAVVQIAKTSLEIEGWGDVYEQVLSEAEETKYWHLDGSGLLYGASADSVWGPSSSSVLDLTRLPPSGAVLSASDDPGLPVYDDSDGVYHVKYLRQEFETYVICLEGAEEIQIDRTPTRAGMLTTFKSVTVYGGVKWFHEFRVNENGPPSEQRGFSNTTGAPSENFKEVLHDYFDSDGTLLLPPF